MPRLDREVKMIFGFVIIFALVSIWVVVSVFNSLPNDWQEFQKKYNECRDKGGSVSYCSIGLK